MKRALRPQEKLCLFDCVCQGTAGVCTAHLPSSGLDDLLGLATLPLRLSEGGLLKGVDPLGYWMLA